MRITGSVFILILAGITLTLPAVAAAAAPAPAPAPAADVRTTTTAQNPHDPATPTIQVYSRETIVDVTVTDANGKPVTGLQQSDFTIEENGKPQPIRSFKEFGDEPPPPAHDLPKLPPGVYTNYQAAPATGPVNILLLDGFHSSFQLMVYEKQAVREYLDKMPEGTQIAIFWLSDSGLHLLQGFTSDHTQLVRAMNAQIFGGSNVDPWTRQWYTIDAFKQLSLYVAGVKGRKNLLWFTPGMPVFLTRDGGYGWHNGDMGVVHRLMDAYELLSAQQVAIYPIDPRGPAHMGMSTLLAEEVAEQSGGLALYNNNDIASLITKAIDHGSRFYTLSYVPPNRKDDGHFHHIKILVDRPGVHLVYRNGYNAEQVARLPPSSGPAGMKAAIEGNAPPATQLLFDAMVNADPPTAQPIAQSANPHPTRKELAALAKKPVHVNVMFVMPQSQIAFEDGPEGTHNGSVEFDVAAYDNNRKLVGLTSQTMKLPLTADEYQDFIKAPFRFYQQLDLPPGSLTVRLGVLDSVSNKVGTLEIPVTLTNDPAQQATATPNDTPCPPRCALPTPPPATPTPR
jgi:VWFA-related protein